MVSVIFSFPSLSALIEISYDSISKDEAANSIAIRIKSNNERIFVFITNPMFNYIGTVF